MERKPSRLASAILTAIVGLLVAYPLSVAPVAFLAQLIDWGMYTNEFDGSPAGEIAIRFYAPLFGLSDPMHNWVVEWWNCGTRAAGWVATQVPAFGP